MHHKFCARDSIGLESMCARGYGDNWRGRLFFCAVYSYPSDVANVFKINFQMFLSSNIQEKSLVQVLSGMTGLPNLANYLGLNFKILFGVFVG